MDDIEIRLKSLRLREPSPSLRRRIFGAKIEQAPMRRSGFVHRRVPLAWAAAFSLLVGCLGFLAAYALDGRQARIVVPSGSTRVEIHIVERPAGQRAVFDFTPSPPILPDGPYRVEVKSGNEV